MLYCTGTAGALLGEGPIWVEKEQALYWLDIKGLAIHRRDCDGSVRRWPTPFRIGSIAVRESGGFIGGSEHGFVAIDPGFERFVILASPEHDRPGNRFNDGKVDRHGAFWAGTMDDAENDATGALYKLDADLTWSRIDDGYRVTNGPAFSPDGRFLYHTDSALRRIYRFELSPDGRAANRHLFAEFAAGEGYPDGMTVDAEGCLWVAFWDGWCLRRLAPTGERLTEVAMPVQRPTSCTFGGQALDQLFITSASIGLDDGALAEQPHAGGLFVFEPGVAGVRDRAFAG